MNFQIHIDDERVIPPHTHGFSDGGREIFINPVAFSWDDVAIVFSTVKNRIQSDIEIYNRFFNHLEFDFDLDQMKIRVRPVENDFSAVRLAYGENFNGTVMQVYVDGDNHVLEDSYYDPGNHREVFRCACCGYDTVN